MPDDKLQSGGTTTTADTLPPNTVRITFLPDNKTFEFEPGKLPYQDHGKPASILDVAINFGLHLEHACGGNCACTTCHVVVKKGSICRVNWMRRKPIAWTWPPICSSIPGWAVRQ